MGSVAGKVFILGEYAVLAGLPAVVAAIGPRFELRVRTGSAAFAPESPAGKLLLAAGARVGHEFVDPHRGRGGFGASTAQFALLYQALAPEQGWSVEWKSAWNCYRELAAPRSGTPPSGADLVAQWNGGVTLFDPRAEACESLAWRGLNLMVFSATSKPGRKTATHSHLEGLDGVERLGAELEGALARGLAALRAADHDSAAAAELGRAFDEYAEALRARGLENPEATQDRFALRGLQGVLGAKGTGAMQSDAMLVLVDPARADRASVRRAAESRALELVCDGLSLEGGISP